MHWRNLQVGLSFSPVGITLCPCNKNFNLGYFPSFMLGKIQIMKNISTNYSMYIYSLHKSFATNIALWRACIISNTVGLCVSQVFRGGLLTEPNVVYGTFYIWEKSANLGESATVRILYAIFKCPLLSLFQILNAECTNNHF